MRIRVLCVTLVSLALGLAVMAQSNPTGSLSGVVTDPSGAVIPGAAVTITQTSTKTVTRVESDSAGRFNLANLSPDSYEVSVNHAGFQASVYHSVLIQVGQTYSLAAKLKVGEATQTVEVQAGQQLIETQSTAVAGQVTGTQIIEIPIASRNAQDLAITMPSAQTTGTPRGSQFDGLPPGALNLTFDGINSQDNVLKSTGSSSFFSIAQPRLDDVQEMSVTTGADASASAEGAVQIAIVSKKGTNQWHGGGWEYLRNNALNANYYFNNLNRLPRQVLRLNEFGYKIGGPLIHNKLFIFTDLDLWENPQGQSRSRNILTPDAAVGKFTYAVKSVPGTLPAWVTCNAGALTCQADLMQMAKAKGFRSSVDAIEAQLIGQVAKSTTASGVTLGAPPSFNQQQINFNAKAASQRRYPDIRLDYNINSKNSIEADYHYGHYFDGPDILNGSDASFPVAPFSTNQGAQISNRNLMALAWRWQLSANMNNEVRIGGQSAPVWFNQGQNLGIYPTIKTDVGMLQMQPGTPGLMSNPFNGYGPGGRNTPLEQLNETLSWLKGSHSMSIGGTFTHVTWRNENSGEQVAAVNVGLSAADPASGMFTAGNLPGISRTDRGTAKGLYGGLIGDITNFSDTINANPFARAYQANFNAFERISQREFSTFFSDSWHVSPSLTFNYGLRWEYEGTPVDDINIYSMPSTGAAGAYGVSGYGNLFKPGQMPGSVPSFVNDKGFNYYNSTKGSFGPSVGLAWTPSAKSGILGALFGDGGKSVLRAGYSIAYDRQGLSDFEGFASANPGTSNNAFLQNSGDQGAGGGGFNPGTLFLQDQNIATGQTGFANGPNSKFGAPFAINPNAGDQVNAYAPGLAQPLIESWSIGFQRQLNPNTALEIRYVGNHATRVWTPNGINLNEVNIFENGFLNEFKGAQGNLNACMAVPTCATNPSFGNQGIPGQVNTPIFAASLSGNKNDPGTDPAFQNGDFVADLQTGLAGAAANELSNFFNGFVQNLNSAGFPDNFWQASPEATGGSFLLTDWNQSTYNGLQVELRRRMSSGVQFNANYTYSHSLGTGDVETLRNYGGFKAPSNIDLRHVFKLENLVDLPFGPGHRFKSDISFVNTLIGGWSWDGITRIQTGDQFQLFSGNAGTFNDHDDGVQLTGISAQGIQSELAASKQTTSTGRGLVLYAPNSLLGNNQLQSNTAVLSTCAIPGALCQSPYVYGPGFFKADWGLVKNTHVPWFSGEGATLMIRANVLDAFNNINFGTPRSSDITSNNFMHITKGYQDFTSTQDPGGRVIELQMRITF